MHKHLAVFAATLTFVALAVPSLASASALTSSQVSSIIGLLQSFGANQSVIDNVRVSLSGGAPTAGVNSCYNFSNSLRMGMSGGEVTALQTTLKNDGETVIITDLFDEQTASAVTGFQQKYASTILTPNGLKYGTGYVGAATRTKLNSLCGGG